MRIAMFALAGVTALLVPIWVLAVVLILWFMHRATSKPTPKRRKR